MNDYQNSNCNTNFVKNTSKHNTGVVFAIAGMITCTIILAKELKEIAEDKHRKY